MRNGRSIVKDFRLYDENSSSKFASRSHCPNVACVSQPLAAPLIFAEINDSNELLLAANVRKMLARPARSRLSVEFV